MRATAIVPAAMAAAMLWAGAASGASDPGDWHGDAPRAMHRVRAADMPAPYATRSVGNAPETVTRPAGAELHVPAGFTVSRFAAGLDRPRQVRVAPNGDIFVAESAAGRIRLLHAADGAARPDHDEIFARGLDRPFGIAFWPPAAPRYVYVAETDKVVRLPYRPGDLHAAGPAETIVPRLPTGGHWTRDVAFSPDGKQMFVSIGSASNDAEGEREPEPDRAQVQVMTPEGKDARAFATGIRNCVSMAVAPTNGALWCATNERDGLGDDLVPDYVTTVAAGAFYGWPWYYIGDHPDPRHAGERPDLRGRITVPDVLLQSHSAPLGLAFYDGAQFPATYRGSLFVALHGSWNRSHRTGYKLVRIPFAKGAPIGGYEDFLTGFVVNDDAVWGRPVAVAVAHDGALLMTEDANGTIWRIAYRGSR